MSQAVRIAVLGTYRSGSSAIAGALFHLGVHMGRPLWMPHYEADDLSKHLRLWWNEPELQERTPKAERVRVLAGWMAEQEQRGSTWVGMKHPLLCLCGDDLLEAWGPSVRFLWAYRPLERSIRSLVSLHWWPGREEHVQRTLWDAAHAFFARQANLPVTYADMMADPTREIDRIIRYVGLTPRADQLAAAIRFIQPKNKE